MTNHTDDAEPSRDVRDASLVAGIGLLLLAAVAGFANLVVVQGLVTPGDATQTAADIMASEGLFRLGVAGLYLAVVLDIVVAWALLRLFTPANSNISLLAAWFRLAYAGVFMVAISQLAVIPDLLSSKDYASAFSADQLSAEAMLKVDAFDEIWQAGLILFGAHLVLIGYLAFTSGYVPRLLGILVAIAGGGYAVDSLVSLFVEGSPFAISTVTFIGEFLLCLWLLIRGRRIAIRPSHTPAG